MIELRNVTKVFHKGSPNQFTALDDISLTIESGAVTAFKGPSGSGKTTLLSIIGAMAKPTSGRVQVTGREITSLPERFLTQIRRSTFGFVFQHYNLITGLSVLENVMLPAYPNGEDHRQLKERALRLLELFDVSQKADANVEWLSGGEAQRVTIARAMINNPQIIIADEPTAHLDTGLSNEFIQIMIKLNQEGKTLLIASHDPLVYESAAVTRVLEFRNGRVLGSGIYA